MPASPMTSLHPRIALEHAAVDRLHQLVRHLELEAGDEGREGGPRLKLGEPFGLGQLPADGVDVHGKPARVDRLPQGVPVTVVEGLHVEGVRDLETADGAPLRDPLDLGHRRLDVVVGDAGDAGEAVGMGLAEVGEPFVVDPHDLDRGFRIVQPVRGPEDPVEHLAPDPVEVLVPHPELGLGEPADPLGSVLVEALGGHPVGAVDHARHVLAPRRPHGVREPEVGPAPRHPDVAPLVVLVHVGHALLEMRRRLLGEELGREPDEIDVAVRRNDLASYVHRSSWSAQSSGFGIRGFRGALASNPVWTDGLSTVHAGRMPALPGGGRRSWKGDRATRGVFDARAAFRSAGAGGGAARRLSGVLFPDPRAAVRPAPPGAGRPRGRSARTRPPPAAPPGPRASARRSEGRSGGRLR